MSRLLGGAYRHAGVSPASDNSQALVLAALLIAAGSVLASMPSALYVVVPGLICAWAAAKPQILVLNSSALKIAGFAIGSAIGVLAYSMLVGAEVFAAARGVARYLIYAASFVALSRVPFPALVWAFRGGVALMGLALPFNGSMLQLEEVANAWRYSFIFSHPNHFAYAAIPVGIYLAVLERNSYVRLFGLGVVLASVALAGSSGGALTIAAVILLHSFNLRRHMVPAVVSLGIIFLAANHFGTVDKLLVQWSAFSAEDIVYRARSHNFGGAGSFSWRVSYWIAILQSFSEELLTVRILGLGLGTGSNGSYAFSFMYTDPHNDFIRVLVENGIVGLCVFAAGLFAFVRGFQGMRLAALAGLLVPMTFGNVLVNPLFVFAFIALWFLARTARAREIS